MGVPFQCRTSHKDGSSPQGNETCGESGSPSYVFAYGNLRPDAPGNPYSLSTLPNKKAWLLGSRLYHFNTEGVQRAAVKLEEYGHAVQGYAVSCNDSMGISTILDEFERREYSPDLYERDVVEIVTESGERLPSFIYHRVDVNPSNLIPSGINRAPPGWARRHKIVLGAARALAYLHTNTTVIHGNIKSKNILLDDNYEAHLADFGLHTLMTSGANAQILESAASQGYKAPELEKMKRANAKTDVYSFGIVLLEILTGRRPGKTKSPNHIVDLPSEVKDAVLEERVSELFDLELLRGMRNPTEEGLLQVLQLAMGCCAPSPQVRPHMKEVVQKLEEIKPKPPSPLYALSPQYNSDDKSSIDTML